MLCFIYYVKAWKKRNSLNSINAFSFLRIMLLGACQILTTFSKQHREIQWASPYYLRIFSFLKSLHCSLNTNLDSFLSSILHAISSIFLEYMEDNIKIKELIYVLHIIYLIHVIFCKIWVWTILMIICLFDFRATFFSRIIVVTFFLNPWSKFIWKLTRKTHF